MLSTEKQDLADKPANIRLYWVRWALPQNLCPDKKWEARRRPHGDEGRDSGDGAMEL